MNNFVIMFNRALEIVLSGALHTATQFSSILSRFGALDTILTLVFMFIFIKRMFGKYNSGFSDVVRKPMSKDGGSK